ncbi:MULTISPECIES: hypothetical protein [Ectopseudomonas]|nr:MULTISPECIES: hypothetical protein [Pseudomonas]ALN21937.1 hypothetical protein DW68_024990 [Pseudomonas mendocina S5.2]MBP3061906.1 hypothetical protein [Pseudomonas chengduensis]NNB75198.1 hypothetical protein [Pseudomonas chengduensis]OEO24562.1 hypothetical protein AX279_18020 [Pseudomonas sp. J237]
MMQQPYSISAPILSTLPIPRQVENHAEQIGVNTFYAGIKELPYPLNTASVWISCQCAWPHEDPDYEGLMFITLALRADHLYRQCQVGDIHLSHAVFPGTVFSTNPLATHWLQPNVLDAEYGFIGLQWEVSASDYHARYEQLRKDLEQLGPLSGMTQETLPAVLEPTGL